MNIPTSPPAPLPHQAHYWWGLLPHGGVLPHFLLCSSANGKPGSALHVQLSCMEQGQAAQILFLALYFLFLNCWKPAFNNKKKDKLFVRNLTRHPQDTGDRELFLRDIINTVFNTFKAVMEG